jgi:general secretion pathway protein I
MPPEPPLCRHAATRSGCGARVGGRRGSGFTLLEVLVALLLLSIALVALVRVASLEARALGQLREATLAQWVAANAIAELRLRGEDPPLGERNGQAEMGDRRWNWRMQVLATDDSRIRRLDVTVRSDDDDGADPVAALSGFLRR